MQHYVIIVHNVIEWEGGLSTVIGVYDEDHVFQGFDDAFEFCKEQYHLQKNDFKEDVHNYTNSLTSFHTTSRGADTSITAYNLKFNKRIDL